MTRRVFTSGRIAALLLFGFCFAFSIGAEPALAGGCGYGGYAPAPVIVQPSCSCCGCGGYGGYGGYGYGGYAAYGYGGGYGYGYAAPYGAYAAEYDVAPSYYYRSYRGCGRRWC
jgi:hypothetical protein